MTAPTLADIAVIRQKGFRPEAVGCFVHEKKILMVYKKKHDLWQLPQGGIEKGELVGAAFLREMTEELGDALVKSISSAPQVVGEDRVEFPPATRKDGKGKHYYFVMATVSSLALDIAASEFDDARWLSIEEARVLARTIYQKGKQRVTLKALDLAAGAM